MQVGGGMTMGRLRAAMAAMALSVALFPAPVTAAVPSRAVCVATWTDSVSPGASLTPGTSTFSSGGQTGSISCAGSVMGHDVTGPGTIGEEGRAQGTCTAGTGSATFHMTIPTTGGPVDLSFPVEFTIAGAVGSRPGGPMPGGFVFAPLEGDCVTTPVTRIAVVMYGVLST
ncbi:MAG: hypothetical protein ACRDKW_14800 [Actinomycetota bacterium]